MKFPLLNFNKNIQDVNFLLVNENLKLSYDFYTFNNFIDYYNLSSSMLVWPKYSLYLRKISNVKKIKTVNYFNLFIKTLIKNGSFLKMLNSLSSVFKFFFFYLKKKNLNSLNLSNYSYFQFISLFFLNNNNSLVSVNTVLWWVLNFLDVNFWITCVKIQKKSKNLKKTDIKYDTKIKIFSNSIKRYKNTFKILRLESSLNSAKTLEQRLFFTFFDIVFNYKQSSLYSKKLFVYKKLFK